MKTYQDKPLKYWADKTGIKLATIYGRLQRGWSLDKACTTQRIDRSDNIKIKYQGKPLTYWAEKLGVSADTIRSRLEYGYTLEEACTTPRQRKNHRSPWRNKPAL